MTVNNVLNHEHNNECLSTSTGFKHNTTKMMMMMTMMTMRMMTTIMMMMVTNGHNNNQYNNSKVKWHNSYWKKIEVGLENDGRKNN